MISRTTKIFINDSDNFINGNTQYKDTISGSLFTTLQDDDVLSDCLRTQYHLNTARPLFEQLGEWKDRYIGSLSSNKKHAALCKDVKVVAGNIIQPINNGNGKKFKGCFIATFDNDKIVFEVHYSTKKIFYVDDIIVGNRNQYNQIETDLLTLAEGPIPTRSVFKQAESLKKDVRRRKGAKLTLQDEDDILHALTIGGKANTQANIANRFGVSRQAIGKLKNRFKADGLL